MSNPIAHLEVTGQNPGELQKFFVDLFCWQLNSDNPQNYGVGMLDDSVGVGIGPAQEGPGAAVFYIGVDSVADSLAKAESLGGKSVMGPMSVPEGPTIGIFTDPEGHMVGLFQGM
jgi:predicted enzyme related to lactoylglutathione lyase